MVLGEELRVCELGLEGCSPQVDRIWGIRASCFNILKAIFYLVKGDYRFVGFRDHLLRADRLRSSRNDVDVCQASD